MVPATELRRGIMETEKDFGVLVKVRTEFYAQERTAQYTVGVGKFCYIGGKPVAFITKRIVKIFDGMDPSSLTLAMKAGAKDVIAAWEKEVV